MEILFKYGKCAFTKPNIDNVDDMVEMMNDEEIASMLTTKKRVITKEVEDKRGEIGITIRKQMQGKHYAKDIINGLIELGGNELKLDEIYSIVFSDNVRSLNCMKQLGFEEYYREKCVVERNGKQVDDIYLKLIVGIRR